MKPKSDTIEEITRLNPSADPTFLAEFSAGQLSDYLGRLRSTAEPHYAPRKPYLNKGRQGNSATTIAHPLDRQHEKRA